MLEDEQTTKWLIVLGIAVTLVLYRVAGKRSDRKRREWFESVATAFGARAEHASEFLFRFATAVDQRQCEVAYRYHSAGLGQGGGIGWRLVATVPLSGVSEIYSLVLQPSDDPAENGVRVRNSGFSPREGWLNAEVRATVSHFYELAPRKEALDVEGGNLISYRGPHGRGRLSGSYRPARSRSQGAGADVVSHRWSGYLRCTASWLGSGRSLIQHDRR